MVITTYDGDRLASYLATLTKRVELYKKGKYPEALQALANASCIRTESVPGLPDIDFSSIWLKKADADSGNADPGNAENVKAMFGALRDLPLFYAFDNSFWADLSHRYFSSFVESWRSKSGEPVDAETVQKYFFCLNRTGRRRALFVHPLSRLWMCGFYAYSETDVSGNGRADPWELCTFWASRNFASRMMLFDSAHVLANRETSVAVIEALKDWSAHHPGIGALTRKHEYEPHWYLNRVGGVRIIDALSRKEIYDLVYDHLCKCQEKGKWHVEEEAARRNETRKKQG